MESTKYTNSEKYLNQIVEIFHKYSREHEQKDALEKTELEGLIKEEAPEFFGYLKKNNISLDTVFKKADLDNDQHLFFPEFVLVLSSIAIEIHDQYHKEHGPEGPDGPEGPGHHGHGHAHGHHH